MAMTISEASAVNTLLHWVVKTTGRPGGPVTDEQALDAAVTLAESAHKKLLAGLTGDHMRKRWPALSVPATLNQSGTVACGNCGSKAFQYEEGVPSVRAMAVNGGRRLTFWSDSTEYDGDDNPGVACANCATPAELPASVEIVFR